MSMMTEIGKNNPFLMEVITFGVWCSEHGGFSGLENCPVCYPARPVTAEDDTAGETGPDTSTDAVQRRVDHVINDLVSGRTTPEQRRGLGTATERAGRVKSGTDTAVGRISDRGGFW